MYYIIVSIVIFDASPHIINGTQSSDTLSILLGAFSYPIMILSTVANVPVEYSSQVLEQAGNFTFLEVTNVTYQGRVVKHDDFDISS